VPDHSAPSFEETPERTSEPSSPVDDRHLLVGLKWRRPDPVVVRATSEGALAAAHYVVHDVPPHTKTPPRLPSVLLARSCEERTHVRPRSRARRTAGIAALSAVAFAIFVLIVRAWIVAALPACVSGAP
jgi:hypothetical protein